MLIINILKKAFNFTYKLLQPAVFVVGNHGTRIDFDLIIDIQIITNSETLVKI